MQNGLVPHLCVWWIKIRRNISGARSPSPNLVPPTQGSSVRKISPHNFWLQKPVDIESEEEILESQAVPPKEPTHGLTHSHSL